MKIKWKIFYHDGSSFSSDDGPPEKAPRDGVLAVIIRDKVHGRLIWSRADGYCWQNGTWVPHMHDGIEQYERMGFGPSVTLHGFGVSDEEFWRVYHVALAWADKNIPARTDLPSIDTPLPSRYRNWAFADLDEAADADLVSFSKNARKPDKSARKKK